jgi:hypothetical protein
MPKQMACFLLILSSPAGRVYVTARKVVNRILVLGLHVPAAFKNLKSSKKALLFVNKKNRAAGRQKNFASCGLWRAHARAPRSKSFLLLFFKKEALAFLSCRPSR